MATAIRVVLQKVVDALGTSGDVVRVKPGYARNFLIPRGLALPATPGNLGRVEDLKARAREDMLAARAAAVQLKQKLESVSIKLTRQVGGENKMYGSVTARDIEETYQQVHGLKFDRRKLSLPEPIRTLGLSEVKLQLDSEVHALLRVEVVKQT